MEAGLRQAQRDPVVPGEIIFDGEFAADIVEWRGPAPFYFAAIPESLFGEVRYAARQASYGWGCVPVTATIAGRQFTTSLFPREGGYMLPLKMAVRRATGIAAGDRITVAMTIVAPDESQA